MRDICQMCGGSGWIEHDNIVGYATRDMAIDGGDIELEGTPIYGKCQGQCPNCNGNGTINTTDESKR